MSGSFYESGRAAAEYLLFHYGTAEQVLPPGGGPAGMREALDFPARCVRFAAGLPAEGRALDLGCAVGRAAFELARHCREVVGIDYSHSFVAAAERLRREGSVSVPVIEEGALTREAVLTRPDVDPARIRFETGDAHALSAALGTFDVIVAANLIDRLADPRRFLESLPALVRPGGQVVLTSPYTWTEEYTARDRWLGGFVRDGVPVRTRQVLEELLVPAFTLEAVADLPFLIREHARKFQWSVAEATRWRRCE